MKKISSEKMTTLMNDLIITKHRRNMKGRIELQDNEVQIYNKLKKYIHEEMLHIQHEKRLNKESIHKRQSANYMDCWFKYHLRMMHVIYSMMRNKTYRQIEGETTLDYISCEDLMSYFKFMIFPNFHKYLYVNKIGSKIQDNDKFYDELECCSQSCETVVIDVSNRSVV